MNGLGKAWAAARALVAEIRARHGNPLVPGDWRFPGECPTWCAGDHRCTAHGDNPAGEHRSKTMLWRTGYGTISVIAVQDVIGHRRVELGASVELDPRYATDTSRMLPPAIDLVIRAVLAGQPGRVVPTPKQAREMRS